jgi:polysaccharide biosynthesis/export protein
MGPLKLLLSALLLFQPADPGGYTIGPDDVLNVVVVGQKDMTGEFPVDRDGMLIFPVLGKVQVAGLSAPELERKLTTLLGDGYLRRPQVSVALREFRSQRVFVTGEVARPGTYAIKADRSLRSVLGDAGNLTASAGHEIVVIRPIAPAAEATVLDLDDLVASPEKAAEAEIFRVLVRDLQSGAAAGDFNLRAGDTINVPRAAQVYVNGHVAKQGSYRYEEGLTVLHALTLAGGLTERGSNKRIKIVRVVDGKPQELKAKLTDPVLPGDTIMVPERFF